MCAEPAVYSSEFLPSRKLPEDLRLAAPPSLFTGACINPSHDGEMDGHSCLKCIKNKSSLLCMSFVASNLVLEEFLFFPSLPPLSHRYFRC